MAFYEVDYGQNGGGRTTHYKDTITLSAKERRTIPFANPICAYAIVTTHYCFAFRDIDGTLDKEIVPSSTDTTYVNYVESINDNGVTFYNDHSSSMSFKIRIY